VVNIRLSYEPLYGKLLGVALHSRIGDALPTLEAETIGAWVGVASWGLSGFNQRI
jgi:hypothetical protein